MDFPEQMALQKRKTTRAKTLARNASQQFYKVVFLFSLKVL